MEANFDLLSVVLSKYLYWINPQIYQVPVAYTVPIAFAVTVLGCCFQVVSALDSCRNKNNIQVWAQCGVNFYICIMAGLQFSRVKETTYRVLRGHDKHGNPFAKEDVGFWAWASPALITCIIVASICTIILCFLGYRLHQQFSWSLFEHFSPDRRIRSRHFKYQVGLASGKGIRAS